MGGHSGGGGGHGGGGSHGGHSGGGHHDSSASTGSGSAGSWKIDLHEVGVKLRRLIHKLTSAVSGRGLASNESRAQPRRLVLAASHGTSTGIPGSNYRGLPGYRRSW